MKKFFIFAAAACVAFASCVKNEPSFTNKSAEGAQVLFNAPVMGLATKGTEIRGEVFPTTRDFAVFGYYQEGNTDYNPDGTPELYMDEVKCDYVAGSVDAGEGTGTWKHATDQYYWPKNGKLTFVAASPSESIPAAECAYNITSTKSTLVIDYTAPADSAKQVDVLYSDWKMNCTSSTEEDYNVAYDGVELAFNHALCIVRLNIKAQDAEAAAAVKVTGLSINQVYQKGTFTSNIAEDDYDWVYDGARADYTIIAPVSDATMEAGAPYTGSKAITTDLQKFANYILLPQHEFVEGSTIKINYSIKHWGREAEDGEYVEKWLPQTHVFRLNDPTVHVSMPTTDAEGNPVASAAITEWKKGTRYTYDITIGVKEIYFAPSVADWEDVKVEYNNDAPQYKEENTLYGN